MVNVLFINAGVLTYGKYFRDKDEETMSHLFDRMETTLPVIPKIGDIVDLSSFIDLDSLSDEDAILVEEEWPAIVTEIYIEKNRLRIHLLNAEYYHEYGQ